MLCNDIIECCNDVITLANWATLPDWETWPE